MEKLSAWLEANSIEISQFAHLVGQTERAVKSWLDGDRRPRWDALLRIQEATGGAVTPNDFLPTHKAEAAQ